MADKPSRALVLYGDGLARLLNPSHTHLHSFASLACCGFLALPYSPPSENEETRITREFAELLDASEAYISMNIKENPEAKPGDCLFPALSERFMGMKAATLTTNESLKCFGEKLELAMLQLNTLVDSKDASAQSLLATELLRLLGLQEGKTSETSQFDLIFVHIGAGEGPTSLLGTDCVNGLVGALMRMAKPGTDISTRLHLSVLMSYGAVCADDSSKFPLSLPDHDNKSELLPLFPRQSYTMKGAKPRANVRHHSPILIAQWQSAVTRKDLVETYTFEDFREHSGNLVIPADRFLHEVAFKLWKAPKYGA